MTDDQAVMDLERKLGNKRRAQLREWLATHVDHAHVIDKDACRECDHASAVHEANRRKGEAIGNAVKRSRYSSPVGGPALAFRDADAIIAEANRAGAERRTYEQARGPAISVDVSGGAGHCATCRGHLDHSWLVRFDGGTVEQRCSLHVPEVKPDLRIWNLERAWDVAHAERADRDADAARRASDAECQAIRSMASTTPAQRLVDQARERISVTLHGDATDFQLAIESTIRGGYALISIADAEVLAYAENGTDAHCVARHART